MHVQRRVGSIMAHDGDAVHGVTRLVKGIRCRQTACHLGKRRRIQPNTASIIFSPFSPAIPFSHAFLATLPDTASMLFAGDSPPPSPLSSTMRMVAKLLNQTGCRWAG